MTDEDRTVRDTTFTPIPLAPPGIDLKALAMGLDAYLAARGIRPGTPEALRAATRREAERDEAFEALIVYYEAVFAPGTPAEGE